VQQRGFVAHRFPEMKSPARVGGAPLPAGLT
jgi:hypothetical protein